MKISKLLKKVKAFLSAKAREQKANQKRLKDLLKKLKKHEKALKKLLETETEETRRMKLGKEITLTRAHRKKGLKNLKALRRA